MGDLLTDSDTIKEAANCSEKIIKLARIYGFNLTKIKANSVDIIETFPPNLYKFLKRQINSKGVQIAYCVLHLQQTVSQLIAKTKLPSIKQVTLPRLELLALQLGTKLAVAIDKQLNNYRKTITI
jgi:Pao retrotransposon peptidase